MNKRIIASMVVVFFMICMMTNVNNIESVKENDEKKVPYTQIPKELLDKDHKEITDSVFISTDANGIMVLPYDKESNITVSPLK